MLKTFKFCLKKKKKLRMCINDTIISFHPWIPGFLNVEYQRPIVLLCLLFRMWNVLQIYLQHWMGLCGLPFTLLMSFQRTFEILLLAFFYVSLIVSRLHPCNYLTSHFQFKEKKSHRVSSGPCIFHRHITSNAETMIKAVTFLPNEKWKKCFWSLSSPSHPCSFPSLYLFPSVYCIIEGRNPKQVTILFLLMFSIMKSCMGRPDESPCTIFTCAPSSLPFTFLAKYFTPPRAHLASASPCSALPPTSRKLKWGHQEKVLSTSHSPTY